MNIGKRIKKLRNSNGITQEGLAEQIAVTLQDISKWELGQALPDINNLVKLSQVLGVSTDFLLQSDDLANNNASLSADAESTDENDNQDNIDDNEEEIPVFVYTEEMAQHYNQKIRIVLGGILALVGFGGMLFLLIFSRINPVIYSIADPGNITGEAISYTGIRAFLLNYNIVWLFILFCVIGIIGAVILLLSDLRNFVWNMEFPQTLENPDELDEFASEFNEEMAEMENIFNEMYNEENQAF